MGLSAQQCRLLTITGRKSDCEFRSMGLSHEKMAMAREMTDISNEYQNSLEKTKMVYDFYGNGDNSTALTYSALMVPSALNDYTPVTVSDSAGRIILDGRFASAARAAGIPQEGVGGLPSDVVRKKFLEGLYGQSIITGVQRDQFLKVPYQQLAGVGSTGVLDIQVDEVNTQGLIVALKSGNQYQFDKSDFMVGPITPDEIGETDVTFDIYKDNYDGGNQKITLADLLKGDSQYVLSLSSVGSESDSLPWDNEEQRDKASKAARQMSDELNKQMKAQVEFLIKTLGDEFAAALSIPNDPMTDNALSYAVSTLIEQFRADGSTTEIYHDRKRSEIGDGTAKSQCENAAKDNVFPGVNDYLQIVNTSYGIADHDYTEHLYGAATSSINLNNLANGLLSLFAKFMEGELASEEPVYNAEIGKKSAQVDNWVTSDNNYLYTCFVGSKFSAETAKMSAFYDTILNQLCNHGWSEDPKINDSEHLQQTLKSGKAFIGRMKDDGYYYQTNYSTDIYIKEITDDAFVARAEAKYNAEKQKISQKEQMLDMKMKNLDTEISALTTEYDTIKSTISKNIEKTFKRYQA